MRAGHRAPSGSSPVRSSVLLVAPLVLIVGMFGVFRIATTHLGLVAGYSVAFAVYWIVWGGAFPLWALGWNGIRRAFAAPRPPFAHLPWFGFVLLALPPIGGFFYAFLPEIAQAGPTIVAVAVARALVNGVAEELGWRAVYARSFPGRRFAGWLGPAVAFAAWHAAPLSVVPSSAGAMFLVGSLLIGLGYGWVAFRTGSIRWTTPFHVLTDAMGLGAAAFALGLG